MTDKDQDISNIQKLSAIKDLIFYNLFGILGLGLIGTLVAFLEAIGLSFISPIIRVANTDNPSDINAGPVVDIFTYAYELIGIPFSIEYLIVGVCIIMTIRFSMAFIYDWLRYIIRYNFEKDLRSKSFKLMLESRTEYFDKKGSDDIMNSLLTEVKYSGRAIDSLISVMKESLLLFMYISVMIYISAVLSFIAIIILIIITVIIRFIIEPGLDVGSRVAKSNNKIQSVIQESTQGIREIKIFGRIQNVRKSYSTAINKYTKSSVKLGKNESLIRNLYDLSAAVSLFTLIYIGFSFTQLSLSELGVFLFAMFRTSPIISRLNSNIYNLEGHIAHYIRTQEFIDEVSENTEDKDGKSVETVESIRFDSVKFSYEEGKDVAIRNINFEIQKGEFIGFVGKSGAGKSTIASLVSGLYRKDSGNIYVNGVDISEYSLESWRERIAVVRQDPFIFNDTLRNNILIGNEEATESEFEKVCKIAKVDEFVDSLPNNYDSELGDNGVRLSGGQKQRVSLARALIKDADFLILDEATSDLDTDLENQVQNSIEKMDEEYGIITIAHRLSTVKNADTIYTLENGEIVESGTHSELIENDGIYAKLASLQS